MNVSLFCHRQDPEPGEDDDDDDKKKKGDKKGGDKGKDGKKADPAAPGTAAAGMLTNKDCGLLCKLANSEVGKNRNKKSQSQR